MATLTSYLQQLQRLLGTGTGGGLYATADLTSYINEARRQVAMDAQCIRALPPISGPITAITVTSGGTSYPVNTRVVISAPDSPSGFAPFPNGAQASASATIVGGQITAIAMFSQGSGYFQPVVTFSGAGQGCVAVANISGINQTIAGQEVYAFSAINPMVAVSGSGIQAIHMVAGISVIFGTLRYTTNHVGWARYQAQCRTYSAPGYQYIPAVTAQFGQGDSGSIYAYPIPSAPYQWEWDCRCIPYDLNNDNDVDALTPPWIDCVKYYAAYLALLGSQRAADAKMYWNDGAQSPGLYQLQMRKARTQVGTGATVNWYGRG